MCLVNVHEVRSRIDFFQEKTNWPLKKLRKTCPICSKEFSSRKGMMHHKNVKHLRIGPVKLKSSRLQSVGFCR